MGANPTTDLGFTRRRLLDPLHKKPRRRQRDFCSPKKSRQLCNGLLHNSFVRRPAMSPRGAPAPNMLHTAAGLHAAVLQPPAAVGGAQQQRARAGRRLSLSSAAAAVSAAMGEVHPP
jgi:hypothetical protein